ncbi:unnamed protein product, partial [Thlaspi arvense]
ELNDGEIGGTTLHTCHPCRRSILRRIYAVFHTPHVPSCKLIPHSKDNSNNTYSSPLQCRSRFHVVHLSFRPVYRSEYPEKYAAKPEEDFPKLDVFICTADPYKKSPMMALNTALSVMAYDYPFDRILAAKFSEHWLPFCKKNNVQDRSHEVYFSSKSHYWTTDDAENLKVEHVKGCGH